MPRVQIPVTTLTRAGVAPPAQTDADATNDHYINAADFQNGDLVLEIVSSDAGAQTVEVVANPALSADGLTIGNLTISIPAGATRVCKQFKYQTFRQGADSNRMYLNPSVSTTLKFRAYKATDA